MDLIVLILAIGVALSVGALIADDIIGPILEATGTYERFGK